MSVADTVSTWFRERLAGGALARDTAAYNQVLQALPDLTARLGPPAAPPASTVTGAAAPAEPRQEPPSEVEGASAPDEPHATA